MMGFERAIRATGRDADGVGENHDAFRRMAARGAAATVLALAENLPRIVNSAALAQEAE